ncbi:MAG: methyltransferase domain-containing protein [Halioglobus sp.]
MQLGRLWPRNADDSALDRALLKIGRVPGYCNICGNLTIFWLNNANFRESVYCINCRSVNRQRQIAAVLLSQVLGTRNRVPHFSSVKDIPADTVIWNAESTRALHKKLGQRLGDSYIASEYISPGLDSGEIRDDVLHVDIQATHFADNSIDYILTSDVMEHVPSPLEAMKETYRILKPDGCHIFTVPFYQHRFSNETRALVNNRGELEHLYKPWFHEDPIRSEGVLVYTVFAPELLGQLEACGFDATLHILHSTVHGILGANGIVVVAKKAQQPVCQSDWVFGSG